MNECRVCGKECSERSVTCSPSCRKAYSRQSVTKPPESVTESVTNESVTSKCDKPNPLAVPGDPDYHGVCIQVDGEWIVNKEPDPFLDGQVPHVLTALDLKHWRGSRPYYLDQDTHLAHLSCEQIHRRLSCMAQWQGSPEYAERVYRLTHGLTALSVPNNMLESV